MQDVIKFFTPPILKIRHSKRAISKRAILRKLILWAGQVLWNIIQTHVLKQRGLEDSTTSRNQKYSFFYA